MATLSDVAEAAGVSPTAVYRQRTAGPDERQRAAGWLRAGHNRSWADSAGRLGAARTVQPCHGRAAAAHLLGGSRRPTAVLACSDYIALGILQATRQAGLQVPRVLSLVGFDDMLFAELVDPPLTTVRQPIAAMDRAAFEQLLVLINKTESRPQTRLPIDLIIRNSVRNLGETSS